MTPTRTEPLSKKRRWLAWTGLALAVVVVWGGYRAVRAHSKLVTLHVKDAEIRDVVRKIGWQTWERILVHRDVRGRVSLDIKDVPLAEALDLVAQEAHCRFNVLYPLYSTKDSLHRFVQGTVGDVDPSAHFWSNLVGVIHPDTPTPQTQGIRTQEPVTLQVTNRELRLVALALTRFGNAVIVPDDSTASEISLDLQACPIPQAIQTIAGSVRRQTTSFYALLPGMGGPGPQQGPGPGGPPMAGGPPPGGPPGPGPGGPPPGGGPPPMMQPPPKEMLQKMEKDYQDLMSVLPEDQRTRLSAERQFQESLRNMTPQQMQQAQSQSGSLAAERREGLRRSTVADRVNRDRQEGKGR